MRVVYHIQSHRAPDQVRRLVERIRHDSPTALVMVSHQVPAGRATVTTDLRDLETSGGVHVLPTDGGYGDFSHLSRYQETVDWLLRNDEPFDWVVNLSGQDYPVVHLGAAERALETTPVDAWVETFGAFAADSHWSPRTASSRYEYRYQRLARVTARRQRLARPLGVVNKVQPWVRFSAAYLSVGRRTTMPLPRSAVHGGSFFANLNRRAVLALMEALAGQPALVDWARHVLAPEEMVLQTVLHGADGIRIRNDCKRYFDFSRSRANHPRTLTRDDVPAMLASGAWFARKLDQEVDPEVLDVLDRAAG